MQQKDSPITHINREWIGALADRQYQLKVKTVKRLAGEIDQNYLIETTGGSSYILKIALPDMEVKQLEMQAALLRYLQKQHLNLALPEPIDNRDGQHLVEFNMEDGNRGIARLLSWLPGRLFAHTSPHSDELMESLGAALGTLSKGLQGFDHPAAHRWIKWDPAQSGWVESELHHIKEKEQRDLADYFFDLFQKLAAPHLPALRHSVNYSDANDYNILVSEDRSAPRVTGFIDFGDAVYSATVNELAIALSYALMDKPDPLAAALPLIRGYHRKFPLKEKELQVLFPLIGARLLLSVVNSAINRKAEPDNEYLLISERPAWDLLKRLRDIPPALAHYAFRHACDLEPCPQATHFRQWVRDSDFRFAPLVDADLQAPEVCELDLGVGSLDLGNNRNFEDSEAFDQIILEILEEKNAAIGIGGYGETRPFYTTDAYTVQGNEGPQWRTVHLGLDVWMPAESAVYAPLDGIIHSIQDNEGERDYGPTIILEHQLDEDLSIFTLYGHLSRISLSGKKPGMAVKSGERLGTIGPRPENGNWPPHLHFQVILDMLGMKGDFPGVGFPHYWAVWKSICPDPGLFIGRPAGPATTPNKREILEQRGQHLGPNLSLSYREPLHMVRGFMQFLYDETGRRYLDTVNNVAHVGHEHPRVVRAAQRQQAVLNTNTRYLHHQIVDYAGELLAKLPDELEVVYFVNSGSEANELALRLARTYTGRQDMIALKVGYHGNTNATIDVSSYKFEGKGGRGAPATTHIIPMPDPYRGPYHREDPDAGRRYAEAIDEVLSQMKTSDRQAAGFIAESILSCGGQVVPPEGFLADAYRRVRRAGGICIADEVQTGFGRVGTHFWAFEQQSVIPDIVTMGKPIGNGHPLAAVATTRTIADAFANGMEYFNTFGGNPVSCAIGREVLAIIEHEGLQQNALETGAYLNQCLLQLKGEYPIIGDVRGPGLFQGIELVRDPSSLEPATEEAAYLANRMRRRSILMSTDGPFENVMKIKPPMCFSRQNVDLLIDQLDVVLSEDFMQVG